MNRSEIKELYYITPIVNVPSILERGILSNRLSKQLSHDSVAMQEIQKRRKNKRIPGAGWLHDYANLYFEAHNPMLSKRRSKNNELCILRVDSEILDLPDVIIADQNAASNYVRFDKVAEGLTAIDKDRLFAKYWTHQNQYEEWKHKSIKCAEVLVPNKVDPACITGVYVANEVALDAFNKLNIELTVEIKSDIFF